MRERFYIKSRRKRKQNRQSRRLAAKSVLLLAGCVLLFCFVRFTLERVSENGVEKTDRIALQDAGNLVWLLADTAVGQEGAPHADPEAILGALKKISPSKEGWLTGKQACLLLALLPEVPETEMRKEREQAYVAAEKWYAWFDRARQVYDPQGQIQDLTLTVLAVGENAKKNDGTALEQNRLVTENGCMTFYTETFRRQEVLCRPLMAVARGDGLYALRRMAEKDAITLSNVWVLETNEAAAACFLHDVCVQLERAGKPAEAAIREQVADLVIADAKVTAIRMKTQKISGRIVRVTEEGVELEEKGFFPFSEQQKVYRLYGRLQELEPADLRIGYAFTDFVLENGRIAAALVSREEKMEQIRVLVKTAGYRGNYHNEVRLQADCACTVRKGAQEIQRLSAGEVLVITPDSALFGEKDRIRVVPDILTGRIRLLQVERAQGIPAYRGSFELVRETEGIVVINEVLLEEYLYAVVPSEMPASYPAAALQAQAVCARTYAWRRMCRAGLPAFGAHVDDSTGFQVYQNIAEQIQTTAAVKETKGKVLFYEGNPAETYYYSTSCGYGTDAGIWSADAKERYPYLTAQRIGEGERFFEEKEPWFRWRYEVEKLEEERLNEAIRLRFAADPDSILTRQADGSFAAERPPETGKIREIRVIEQNSKAAQKLLIEGENAAVLVCSEYNIRSVLCDGRTRICRGDGSFVQADTLLPSGFFDLTTLKEGAFVVGYSLNGGGCGHGVGMSQNGAKNMAAAGKSTEEILNFFYKGCQIVTVGKGAA